MDNCKTLLENLRFCATRNSLSRWKRDVCTEAADTIERFIAENERLLKQLEEYSDLPAEPTAPTDPEIRIDSNIAYYDQVEVFPDCTVQVLTNTRTGDISYGWWVNAENEDEGEDT